MFTADEIARRVAALGADVTSAFAGREVRVVGLMKSCLVFMADLIRHVPLRHDLPFPRLLRPARRRAGAGADGHRVLTEIPYEGQDILLLDDIIDTGHHAELPAEPHPRARTRSSVKVCVLIDKPGDRKVDVRPDWAAFTLGEPLPDDRFIVGYGWITGSLPRRPVPRDHSRRPRRSWPGRFRLRGEGMR